MAVVTIKEKIMDALETFWNYLSQIVVKYDDVVNNCTSTDTTLPLSAAQGKVLSDKLDNIGTYYQSAWSASSASSDGTALTQEVSLPKGTFLVIGVLPNCSGSALASIVGSNIQRPFRVYHNLTPYGCFVEYIQTKTTNNNSVYLALSGSSSITFSETTRGCLTCVRIA